MEKYGCAAVIQAVTEAEWNAVPGMYPNWEELRFDGDSQAYFTAEFLRGGKPFRVIAVRQNEMGMISAAVTSMKAISRFRPKYIIMVGIAAGVALSDSDEQFYGDVMVADEVWNCGTGKFVSPEKASIRFDSVGFIPRPTSVELLSDIRGFVEQAISSEENQCHVFIGAMACGHSVITNREILDKHIRVHNRRTIGLDMESYAVAYAAQYADAPQPKALIINSVCDFADSEKSDKYQKFAAYTSCEFAKMLYEKYLPV